MCDQFAALAPPDRVALAARLTEMLGEVVDPRKRRGVRHRLIVVITPAVCAVAAGARSFVAISEWVTGLPAEVAGAVGTGGRVPCELTIRGIVRRLDADLFDAVIDQHARVVLGLVAVHGESVSAPASHPRSWPRYATSCQPAPPGRGDQHRRRPTTSPATPRDHSTS